MATTTLLSAVGATGAGTGTAFSDDVRARTASGIVQAIISATATVALEGSVNNSAWFTIISFTASGAQVVDLPPYVRGNVTAFTSGTVTLLLDVVPR